MPSSTPAVASPTGPTSARLATAAVAAVGLALLGWAGWEAYRWSTSAPQNQRVAWGTTLYFLTFGLLVLLVAWAFGRRQGWAFGAAVFVLLLALAIAGVMVQAGFWWGAVPLGVVSLGGLVAAFRSDTREVFGR